MGVVIGQLWKQWASICKWEKTDWSSMESAIFGLFHVKSPFAIYAKHHECRPGERLQLLPPQCRDHKNKIYSVPGKDFSIMARDILYIMKVIILRLESRANAPTRWKWDYILMKRIGGWRSAARRSFAMLVCLVLSAATPDLNCIQATVNLEDAGYLDIEKLAKAKASDIARYIRVAGIHVR